MKILKRATYNSSHISLRVVSLLALVLALPLAYTSSLVGVVNASSRMTGHGTFADVSVTVTSVKVVGSNIIITDSGAGTVSGTLTGTYLFVATITVLPTGLATYSAVDTCRCTVGGKSGTLVFNERGSGNVLTGSFQSLALIVHATGQLDDMEGRATLQGIQNPITLLTSGTYTINLSEE